MYFVYIMTNRSRTLYIGVTNSLVRRVREHKTGIGSGFTAKYKLDRLVYFEHFDILSVGCSCAAGSHHAKDLCTLCTS
jgi:putative endonuclease